MLSALYIISIVSFTYIVKGALQFRFVFEKKVSVKPKRFNVTLLENPQLK